MTIKRRLFRVRVADMPRRLLVVSLAMVLSGCAVGPDFSHPAAPDSHAYAVQGQPAPTVLAGGVQQHYVEGQDIPADWWTVFHCTHLNQLIGQALAANPGIAAADAALAQAQEYVAAQKGYFYPTASIGYSLSRQQLAGNMGGNSPGLQGNGSVVAVTNNASTPYVKPIIYNWHTANLSVGYTPDVFGSNSRQVESLQAQADAQRFQLEAARITLVANLVAAALQEAALVEQIQAARQIVADNQRALDILNRQFETGYAMRMDVAAQESALAAAETVLPPLDKQLEQTRDLIRVLAGKTQDQSVGPDFTLAEFSLPAALPLSLPADLIRQRPDVRVAEALLHAASANVGVAIAARLPQFSINGIYGGEATEFGQMFQTGGPFWMLVGNLTQPVFDGGTLLHRQRAADRALAQAAAQYRATVLTALQNVADTLHAVRTDADGLAAAERAERAARVTRDLTRKQQDAGYVSALVWLQAEQAWQQARMGLIQAQSQRLGDTAALYEALGGGWWHRSPASNTN